MVNMWSFKDETDKKAAEEEDKDEDEDEDQQVVKGTIVCVDSNFINLTSIRLMLEMTSYEGEIECF